jgi:DNA polymerase III epsilon subunit-like protein
VGDGGGGGRSIAKACYIIRPDGFTIPEEVVRIHGISTERALVEGVPLLEVLAKFADDMSIYGVDTAVAHNMAFDDSVLLAELYRAAASETCDMIKYFIEVWTTRKKRCTMRMGARLDGANGKWPKLHVMYEQLCGPLPDDTRLHNADTDARLCADIYEKLLV